MIPGQTHLHFYFIPFANLHELQDPFVNSTNICVSGTVSGPWGIQQGINHRPVLKECSSEKDWRLRPEVQESLSCNGGAYKVPEEE